MKMSLSQYPPPLSYHCVSLKEKVADEEGKWKKKQKTKQNKKKNKNPIQIFYKHFNKTEFNLLLLGFRELICIEMFYL